MAATSGLNQETMEKLIADLEEMRAKDPDGVTKLLQSIGLPGSTSEAKSQGKTNESTTPEQLESLARMLQAISEADGADSTPLNMPGGKAALGTRGMEAKVRLYICLITCMFFPDELIVSNIRLLGNTSLLNRDSW